MTRPALPVVFTLRAAREVQEAHRWWTDNRPAASSAIQAEVERAIGLIALQPAIGAKATSVRLRNVRRVALLRIDYFLYYRVQPEADSILISSYIGLPCDA